MNYVQTNINNGIHYPVFHLHQFNEPQEDNDVILLLEKVNAGCQGYIISADISIHFANIFTAKIDKFDQRYVPSYMVFVPLDDTNSSYTNNILNHPIINGIHILI